jgi:hypothetical protein
MTNHSIYKTRTLEHAVQSAFTSTRLLYGQYQPDEIRVAVTTTCMLDGKAAIMTNYHTESRPETSK